MKRSGFKKRAVKPLKRTPLKKKSKQKISTIQNKLWKLCKQIIRIKYGNTCYTCESTGLTGSNWHTSHLIPKASLGAYLKYDLRLLRPACYHCNINLGGNGAIYIEKVRRVEGNEYVDRILKDRQVTVNAMDHYLKLIEEYTELLNKLTNTTNGANINTYGVPEDQQS